MANIGGANGVGQDPLKDLTVFPEGCSSKSGGLLCPPQIHTIYPFYRNAELSEPTDEQLCDMEVLTPGRELQFVTTTPASSLLRACKTSREVILKTHSGCIESAHRKIRFNEDHDFILMYTPKKCCWAFPGIYSLPETIPDFRKIFADVQHVALTEECLEGFAGAQLHRGPKIPKPSGRPRM